jgi:hypothetical protein
MDDSYDGSKYDYAKYLMGKEKNWFLGWALTMPSLLLLNFADCFSFSLCLFADETRNCCNVLFSRKRNEKTSFIIEVL